MLSIPKIETPQILQNILHFVNRPMLIGILVVFLLAYFVVACVLMYHWYRYGMNRFGILVAEGLFLFVSVVLFVFASLAIYYY